MANGINTGIVKAVLSLIYRRIINYVCTHPELDGALLRLKIRSIFGTSMKAERLDTIINIARSRCPKGKS